VFSRKIARDKKSREITKSPNLSSLAPSVQAFGASLRCKPSVQAFAFGEDLELHFHLPLCAPNLVRENALHLRCVAEGEAKRDKAHLSSLRLRRRTEGARRSKPVSRRRSTRNRLKTILTAILEFSHGDGYSRSPWEPGVGTASFSPSVKRSASLRRRRSTESLRLRRREVLRLRLGTLRVALRRRRRDAPYIFASSLANEGASLLSRRISRCRDSAR